MLVPALRTAEDYFGQAVQARTGQDRGLALQALVQTPGVPAPAGRGRDRRRGRREVRQGGGVLLTHSQEDSAQARTLREFIPEDGRACLADLLVPTGPAAGESDPLSAPYQGGRRCCWARPAAATALVAQRRELLEGRRDEDMTDATAARAVGRDQERPAPGCAEARELAVDPR